MIFVTVGTITLYKFDRLIKKIDEIAGKIDEEIITQVGYTNYEPRNTRYVKFLSPEKMRSFYSEARIVICHAGIGSILNALKYCKLVIIVPRMKKYNEHFDDHQLQIANELEKEIVATVVFDIDDLEEAIKNVRMAKNAFNGDNRLAINLKNYINNI